MKYTRDKSIDRLIVLHKGKICLKVKELRKRHKNSHNNWNVLSGKTSEIYG